MEQLKKLREMTGAGVMDCKKALEATDGDFSKAIEFLRQKGIASAAQRENREAKEGLIAIEVEGRQGAVAEFQLDIAAMTLEFKAPVGLEISVEFDIARDRFHSS